MINEDIINSIESLPPLSDTVVEVQNLFSVGLEDININAVIKSIEKDALLSANILKIANAPIHGFSKKIASIPQAVTLFGLMQVYGFVVSYGINESVKADTRLFGVSSARFNDICNLQSALMFQWYSKISIGDAQLLAPLALMMEIGKLVMVDEVKNNDREKEFMPLYKGAKNLSKFEKEFFGMTSYEITSMLFKHWNLDPLYVDVLNGIDNVPSDISLIKSYIDAIEIVKESVNVKAIFTKESIMKSCVKARELGFSDEDFVKVALRIKKSYIKELKVRDANK